MLNRSSKTLCHRLSRSIVATALVVLPCLSFAQPATFMPFEVEYDVGNNVISAGSATLALSKHRNDWVYSLKTTPSGVFKLTGKGKIQEVSVFTVTDSTDKLELQTQRYTYRQDSEKRRSVDAWFDWQEKELKYLRRGEEFTESFSDPVLDRLSVTLTVMSELKKDNFEKAEMKVFDSGRIKTMVFTNEGFETVTTRRGPIKTVRVRSTSLGGSTRHTITWFAPELDYVPVKVEQFKRNKLVARLTLTKLRNRITDSGGAPQYATGNK